MNNINETNGNASIMIVDDTPANLKLLSIMLEKRGYHVSSLLSGKLAIEAAKNNPPDLILLDINMPEMNGFEVCKVLKEDRNLAEIPVIFISGLSDTKEKLEAFSSGGIDYITKPFQLEEVHARVATHLKLHRLQLEIEQYNKRLEKVVELQMREIVESQMATIFAIAKLSESRDDDTGRHLEKVQLICREVTLKLKENEDYKSEITKDYAENIYHASPLHDIGKVAIPDKILLKTEKLTPEEFEIMKTHTALGASTLYAVSEKYPNNHFIEIGIAIARYHHERWDGTGYPDRLTGNDIPLSARIMAVADVYEAVRSKRCYKPSFPHSYACEVISKGSGTQFDPAVAKAFTEVNDKIERISEDLK